MRFTSSTLVALPAFLLASSSTFTSVSADECTCPSNNGGGDWSGNNNGGNNWGNDGGNNWAPAVKPIKYVPKVEPTEQNLSNGASQAVKQLTDSKIVPPSVAQEIQQAIDEAIKKHTEKVVRVEAEQSGSTTTFTVTPTQTVVPTTVTVANGSITTDYVTKTITAMPPGATILSNETIDALDSIQDAIRDAIAAVNLSKTGLDEATQAEMSTCLTAVLENGGLPAGYSCISQYGSTSSGLKSTFNNILEQFLGILPAKIIDDLQDAVMPMLTNLLPGESTLLDNINSAMSSVIASLSGNSVTAIEMMQSCYSLAIRQNSNTSYLQCYMSDGGPYDTLNTAMNSVIQQFVGYLPGTLLDSVQNLTASTLKAGAYGDVSSIGTNLTSQLDAALASVTSALTGNSVTLMQQLQACANKLLQDGDAEAAQNCIAQSPAQTARTMVMSVAQQYSGYLPSSFFTDLVNIISSMSATGEYSKTQLITALDQAFNNANMGPAYVGCFEQVQTCVLGQIESTGNYSSTCPGPVAGCELMGSNSSVALANTTIESNTTTLPTDNATAALANTTVLPSTEDLNATSSTVLPADVSASASASANTTDISSAASDASTGDAAAFAASATSFISSAAASSSADASSTASESASSSEGSDAPASSASVFEDASAIDATQPTPTQRLKNRAQLRRSHAKLRLLYDEHYQKL